MGVRRIRKVKYEGQIYSVKGTQNGGAYIRLNEIKKIPRVDLLTPYKFMNGFVYGLYIKESQQILNDITEEKDFEIMEMEVGTFFRNLRTYVGLSRGALVFVGLIPNLIIFSLIHQSCILFAHNH